MKKMVYLSGACKNESYEERAGWRRKCSEWINNYSDNFTVFNPVDYFDYSRDDHQSELEVFKFERRKVKEASVILVNLNNANQSVGTVAELVWAYEKDIPVIGFYDGGSDISHVHEWIRLMCDRTFDGKDAMIDALKYIVGYYK
ncbi:MAG: nucleoside 2-deoxyribosyltransferase domain-containing protein [Eisenbergiella sp.]